ncbi:dihydroorotase [Motiliproteus sp. MSK22-1]|uniref:dihydroorotase n=1 Tax=Motiliproteus sp. MSK22-1 TaxID=1897630 RepID=UPI000978AEE0|nr:dihydroorotase [Motiliproteus sp. MSK22-1]OMH39570.1 dihydroorotase [Motiliproteus sp. MSK22-1]
MKVHIRGGRLIDPANKTDANLDLFIEDGKVVAQGDAPKGFVADQLIDAEGQIVCPGFVDLQAHLREPGFTQKGNIGSESAAAAAGGVTTLCCPPTTLPVMDSVAVVQLVQERAAEVGLTRVLPLAALTKGLEGEQLSNMVSLKEAGCVALSNARKPIKSNQTLLRCLEYLATYDLLMFVQPQDYELSKNGCAHDGQMATVLGLPGIPEAAETLDLARYLLLAEQTGARLHVGQLSTAHSLQMIADARSRGVKVTADVAIHHLLLTDENLENYDSAYHLIPPLRGTRDREGLLKVLEEGGIQALCSDHQPQDAAAKDAPFSATEPGMTGLQTLLPLSLRLVEQGRVSLNQMIALLTRGPAEVLGIERGQLGVGAEADVCIFAPEQLWTLNEETCVSKGLNTPYMNSTLKGRVNYTLLAGRVVFQAEQAH